MRYEFINRTLQCRRSDARSRRPVGKEPAAKACKGSTHLLDSSSGSIVSSRGASHTPERVPRTRSSYACRAPLAAGVAQPSPADSMHRPWPRRVSDEDRRGCVGSAMRARAAFGDDAARASERERGRDSFVRPCRQLCRSGARGIAGPVGRVAESLRLLIAERDVGLLVVGWPLEVSGVQGQRCRETLAFVEDLRRIGNLTLPVTLVDERFTTQSSRGPRRVGGAKERARVGSTVPRLRRHAPGSRRLAAVDPKGRGPDERRPHPRRASRGRETRRRRRRVDRQEEAELLRGRSRIGPPLALRVIL